MNPAFSFAISFSSVFFLAAEEAQGGRKGEFVAGAHAPDPERDLTHTNETTYDIIPACKKIGTDSPA